MKQTRKQRIKLLKQMKRDLTTQMLPLLAAYADVSAELEALVKKQRKKKI